MWKIGLGWRTSQRKPGLNCARDWISIHGTTGLLWSGPGIVSPLLLFLLTLFFQIYDWIPDLYANSSELPEAAPNHLRQYIADKEAAKDPMVGNMVWMSCEGENPADRENIGEIDYFPYPGIPKYYFPYQNQKGYLSPAIFAHLKNPKRTWNKNRG